MNKLVLIAMAMVMATSLCAQIRLEGYRQADIHPDLFQGHWKAHWIAMPEDPGDRYGVYHFRKSFELTDIPEEFIIHASADNRYKLFVNSRFVSLGPARCDVFNWNFETIDLAPYLQKGKNTVAAIVWNYADKKPLSQISFGHTGLIIQGNSPASEVVNSNTSWLCLKKIRAIVHGKHGCMAIM